MADHGLFPRHDSKLQLHLETFQSNRAAWKDVITRLEDALETASSQGAVTSLLKHQERGQLLARDRIALLLDPDSPFLELCPLAGHNLRDSSPCASMIAGIGSVSGRPCLVLSHIPTQSGGAWNELTGKKLSDESNLVDAEKSVKKQNRVTEIAGENSLPIIALVQSAGVFLPQQFKVFHAGGQIFRDLAIRSQKGQQSCAVVFGSSTAGGAYHPALSDYTIFVENQAQVFLAGPPLVKMATGEIIDPEELGGAKTHATLTGLADQIASDEFDAVRKVREWMSTLPSLFPQPLSIDPLPPRYPAGDLFSLVNPDIRKSFDMMEVLLRIVDDSRLSLFKPVYGKNLITAWAKILGHVVGIVANQVPVINPNEASKGAQFIRLCNQQNVPIVFLHNVTGFMVGSKAEHAAIIKKGAQLVSAVSCSTVPHISVILGASYGAGNYAMCGRAYKPRFLFTWPIGRCSVMGPDQLAGVMESIQANSAKTKGIKRDAAAVRAEVQAFRDGVEKDSECYSTSAALLDDGVIDPRDTRDILGMCLEVVKIAEIRGTDAHRVLARF